ncbi:MAG TPA: hypothetical protein VIQ30_23030 [Pseudonocardia sp.]
MAFPTVVDQQPTSNNATFTMPSFSPGDLLLATVGAMVAPSGVSSASGGGWTLIGSTNIGSTTYERVWAKTAEAGDTFFVSGGFSTGGFVLSVSGWSGSIPSLGYAGSTGSLNPPLLTMPAAKDFLWIAGCANYQNSISGAPASYTNLATATYNSNGDHKIATARRSLNAAGEDPGAFTGTASFAGAWVVAVPPSAGSPPPGLNTWRRRRTAVLVR